MTIREIVADLLDNSPDTVFHLWGLADTVGLRNVASGGSLFYLISFTIVDLTPKLNFPPFSPVEI